jgi:phosphate transport system substrate-binding protein
MGKQQREKLSWLVLLGSPILIVVTLVWAAGLLGRGVWRLAQQSRLQSTQPQLQPKNFAQVQNVPAGVFRYGGSDAWALIRLRIDSEIQSERPEFQLRYVNVNHNPNLSKTAIEMLLSDRLTILQASRPLHQAELTQAKQRGFKLKQIPVAMDGIAIVVNPQLKIPGLTLDQLRAIYSGKIRNWQQLGGPNLQIQPLSHPTKNSDTSEFFVSDVLNGGAFGSNIKYVSTATEAIRYLTLNPGGIYYGSAAKVAPQCSIAAIPLGRNSGEFIYPYQQPLVSASECPKRRNRVNTEVFQTGQYPITRYLYVVIKQNNSIEEQAGTAYTNFLLATQGQELLAREGFVRIR